MKKLIALALVFLMVPGLVLAQEVRPVRVYLNGEEVLESSEDRAVIKDDRTFLPVRYVSEELGYQVSWSQDKQEVGLAKGQDKVTMAIGSKSYTHKGKAISMDVAPFLDAGKTYVPVRFVGEALGTRVDWDGDNRLVILGDYQAETDFDKEERRELEKPALSLIIPDKFKDNLVLKEEDGVFSFYDKKAMEDKSDYPGLIGGFYIERDPEETPVPKIILGKTQEAYLVFNFASDVQVDPQDEALAKSYQKSTEAVKEILKTVKVPA